MGTVNLCKTDFSDLRDPIFFYTPKSEVFGKSIFNEIHYKSYYAIPHETAHYVSKTSDLSKECLEEIIGDLLTQIVFNKGG